MRRERQQETQDKIRLGLLPPPQPKVNLSNLMRVLGSDAIQDPTKVEAEVRAQMERRAAAGRKHNEEKKLTEEEKREKKMKKFEETQDSVVDVAVFR